jgi:hypothetical protein
MNFQSRKTRLFTGEVEIKRPLPLEMTRISYPSDASPPNRHTRCWYKFLIDNWLYSNRVPHPYIENRHSYWLKPKKCTSSYVMYCTFCSHQPQDLQNEFLRRNGFILLNIRIIAGVRVWQHHALVIKVNTWDDITVLVTEMGCLISL